jgi:hypothetical protein
MPIVVVRPITLIAPEIAFLSMNTVKGMF